MPGLGKFDKPLHGLTFKASQIAARDQPEFSFRSDDRTAPMSVRITDAILRRARQDVADNAKAYDLIDQNAPGLMLRAGPRGAKWAWKAVRFGRTVRLTFGGIDLLTVSEARELAAHTASHFNDERIVPDEAWVRDQLRRMGKLAPGPVKPDPAAEMERFRLACAIADLWTFAQAREAYLEEVKRTKRKDTYLSYGRMLRMPELKPLENIHVNAIKRRDVARIVASVHGSGRERHAEHLASVLRPMWTFLEADHNHHRSAVREGTMKALKAPPHSAEAKPRANGKTPGTYVPKPSEVGHVLAVCRSGALAPEVASALELLIATVQRRRPVADARVADFVDWLEMPGWGVWSMEPAHRKTAAKRKDKNMHRLPLPPPIWDVVQAQAARASEAGSPYLFPQSRPRKAGGSKDSSMNPSSLNHRMLDMGVLASPHDLRRAMSNYLQKHCRIPRTTVKMILDHNEGIPTNDILEAHYTDDDRLDLKGPAMEMWCKAVEGWAAEAARRLPPLPDLRAALTAARRARAQAGNLNKKMMAESMGEREGQAA